MTYHLEHSGSGQTHSIEVWSDGPVQRCVCLLPADPERRAEAERLAALLLAAANGGKKP